MLEYYRYDGIGKKMDFVGISLGVLIGIVTGVVMILLINAATQTKIKTKDIITLIGEFLSIPTFWFGGPWLTTSMLKIVNLNDILQSYMLSLVLTFVLVILNSLIRFIIRKGNEIKDMGEISNV